MTLDDALDLAAQYQSPLAIPAMSDTELQETKKDIATTLRQNGWTVPNWIDDRSRDTALELRGSVAPGDSASGAKSRLQESLGKLLEARDYMEKGEADRYADAR